MGSGMKQLQIGEKQRGWQTKADGVLKDHDRNQHLDITSGVHRSGRGPLLLCLLMQPTHRQSQELHLRVGLAHGATHRTQRLL